MQKKKKKKKAVNIFAKSCNSFTSASLWWLFSLFMDTFSKTKLLLPGRTLVFQEYQRLDTKARAHLVGLSETPTGPDKISPFDTLGWVWAPWSPAADFFKNHPADFWEWKQLEIALNFLCKYHWLQRQISLSPLCLVLSLSALSLPFPSRWLLLFDIKLMRFPFSKHILAVPGLKEDSIYVYTLDDICFAYLHKPHPPYLYVFQMLMFYSCTSSFFFLPSAT